MTTGDGELDRLWRCKNTGSTQWRVEEPWGERGPHPFTFLTNSSKEIRVSRGPGGLQDGVSLDPLNGVSTSTCFMNARLELPDPTLNHFGNRPPLHYLGFRPFFINNLVRGLVLSPKSIPLPSCSSLPLNEVQWVNYCLSTGDQTSEGKTSSIRTIVGITPLQILRLGLQAQTSGNDGTNGQRERTLSP